MATRSAVGICFAFSVLTACEGTADTDDVSDESVVLQGAVQKGPLALGSTVHVAPLDAAGTPTGTFFTTSTINDAGEFWVEVPKSGPVAIEGSGFYYNEISGELSGAWITLRAIYLASKTEPHPILVNVITHLTYERVRALRDQGQTFANAIATAEQELQLALGIGLADLEIDEPGTALDILGGATLDNAYLFAVSTVLAQAGIDLAGGPDGPIDANLQVFMNELALDLADDGQIAAELHETINAAELGFDTATVEASLAAWLATIGSDAEVPDLDVVLDQDDDLLLNVDDNCARIANADQADVDSDEVGDVCDNCPDIANDDQSDVDHDGIGDLCELDCGNGQLDDGETCDDGNAIDGDGCNADCEPSGQLVWQIEVDPYPAQSLSVLDMSVDPDGNVALVGIQNGIWPDSAAIQRYDAAGQLLFQYMQPDYLYGVLAEPGGAALGAGGEGLVRIDHQAQVVWSFALPQSFMLGRNGAGPIIVGTTTTLKAIDDSGMGSLLWSVAAPPFGYHLMTVTSDDTVVAAATANGNYTQAIVDRYDFDGNLLSTALVDGNLVGLGVLPTGEIAIAWRKNVPDSYVSLLSADATTTLWTVAHEGSPSTYVNHLAVDSLGRIAYVWYEYEFDISLEYVRKLDANGGEIWTASLDHGSWETVQRVALGADGSVHTLVGGDNDVWLHKYSP